jgi:hypothetical protein
VGQVKEDPLLQVRLRAADRPGALLDVLGSLNQALDDKLSHADWSVWHAHIRVTGRTLAICSFVCMPNDLVIAADDIRRQRQQEPLVV